MPDALVFRHELVHRFNAAVAKKLVLVVAPPGYGKSVLIGQWARTVRSRRIAWVRIGADDDPHRFAHRLCSALSAVDGKSRERISDQVAYGSTELGQGFLSAFLADARTISPTVLVLDDVPVAENRALLAELAALIDQAPPQLHFVVAARIDPALRYHRLRLSDQFAEFRQEDLVFEVRHAQDLIRLVARREVTDGQIDRLLERTEGWGAGLQLAALSLRNVPDVDRFVDDFAGDDRHVAEYLTAHVLGNLSTDVRRFLLETSVLDRLSASLCDAVTGRHDAADLLERLAIGGLFVTRIDGHRGWFRYHQLFRTLLQHQLRESDGDVEPALLERAADWHFAHGEIERAVDYLCAAGATDRTVTAVQMYGHALHATGRITSAVRWLDSMTLPEPPRRAAFLLLRAAVHMLAGNTAAADALLRDLGSQPSTAAGDRVVADAILTWSVHDRASPDVVLAAVDRVLRSLDTTDPTELRGVMDMITPESIRQLVLVNGAAGEAYAGRSLQARVCVRRARAEPRRLVASEIDGLGTAALVDAWAGRLGSAQQQGARALAIADQSAVDGHPSTVAARLALGQVARERNELDEAQAHLAGAATILQRTRRSVLQTVLATEEASLLLARGEPANALDGLLRVATGASPPAVAARRDAVVARLLAATGDPKGALQMIGRPPYDHVELVAAAVRATVEMGDLDAARRLLATWPDEDEPGSRIQHVLWLCIVDDLTSGGGGADPRLVDVFAAGRREGHIRLFLDAGHHAVRLVRTRYHGDPNPYLRQLVEHALPRPQSSAGPVRELIEQLTGRECEVLRYLATTLDNAEIAAEIGVSVNTLKTHLKHIYRKLGVERRRTAIAEAERLHLL